MQVELVTSPALEPVTLAELKLHLKNDSGSFADNILTAQSLAPDNYAIAANYTTHVGTGVDALGFTAVVNLNSGTNGATGTVDCKIQESDDDITYTDWTGGAFVQVTTANDNAIQEIEYTGAKQYIRTVAQVLLATCDFGTTVIKLTGTSIEDDLLDALIETARKAVENDSRRQLITATWDYFLDAFPSANKIKLPFGNLQTTDLTVKYTDSDGDETTMTITTDYLIETNGDQCGFIVLPYSGSWPSYTLYPSKPIEIRFKCGYGAAASTVPATAKQAILMLCSKLYEGRGEDIIGQTRVEDKTYERLVRLIPRLYDIF